MFGKDGAGFVVRGAIVALVFVHGATCGCSDEPDTFACPAIYIAGLRVRVRDVGTGDDVCDAIVTATDGEYTESLEERGDPSGLGGARRNCWYAASQRAGTYVVRVRSDGYRAPDDQVNTIRAGRCGPLSTEPVEVALVRE